MVATLPSDIFLHLEQSESGSLSYLHESVYKGSSNFNVHTSHLGTFFRADPGAAGDLG